MMHKRRQLFFWTFGCVLLVDQVSKWWSSRHGDIFYNTGISLGLFSVLPSSALTLILLAVLFLVWWLYKDEWAVSPLASGLFFGGGVSNVIDRVVGGSVRDWLTVPYFNLYNNLADYAIAVGLVIVLGHSLRKKYQLEIDDSQPPKTLRESEE